MESAALPRRSCKFPRGGARHDFRGRGSMLFHEVGRRGEHPCQGYLSFGRTKFTNLYVEGNVWIAKMAFTPPSLSLPWRSIVIRLPIDVGRKRKEVSGWVMDQDDWSPVAHFSNGSWRLAGAFSFMTNGCLKNPKKLLTLGSHGGSSLLPTH